MAQRTGGAGDVAGQEQRQRSSLRATPPPQAFMEVKASFKSSFCEGRFSSAEGVSSSRGDSTAPCRCGGRKPPALQRKLEQLRRFTLQSRRLPRQWQPPLPHCQR